MRTSDRKYHSITYEIPLDLDYHEMVVREYEISTEENFFKTGTISLGLNGTQMDVKYFVNSNGFHVANLQKAGAPVVPNQPKPTLTTRASIVNRPTNARPVRNQQQQRSNRPGSVNGRVLNPSFSRPELLTGDRSVQPGK